MAEHNNPRAMALIAQEVDEDAERGLQRLVDERIDTLLNRDPDDLDDLESIEEGLDRYGFIGENAELIAREVEVEINCQATDWPRLQVLVAATDTFAYAGARIDPSVKQ
ncbi:hypothetical protein [Roseibium album]|uniref:hypothetical protein n=1 Tax=Roseibium album TaxID=311410 RepID=UPI0024930206|nr:hypothetical protein [Roseibium album]